MSFPDTITGRPNTSGTRGGRAHAAQFPIAPDQYSKDNEQDFRAKAAQAISILNNAPSGSSGTTPTLSTDDITNASSVSGTTASDALNALLASLALKAPLASPAFTGTPTAPTASQGNNSTQLATTAYVDTGLALKAPLASPALTGTPTAPTAAADTNTTQIATTAFVIGQAGTSTPIVDGTGAAGTSKKYSREDHVHPTDTSRAPLASPTFTGVPAAPTASPGTNTTQIATTAYADAIAALKANLASPTFTGTPAAPTAAADTNTTQIATTAFVIGQAGANNPIVDGTAAPGTSKKYSREDHVHPTDTSRAALASPTFTGTPAAPTASPGTNSTQIATTAYADAISALKETLGEVIGINSQSGTTYTLVIGDKGKTVEVSNASAITLTIPPHSSVAFPTNSYVNVVQTGAGQITIAAGAGVTLRNRNGLKCAGQYAMVTLYQRASDEWVVGGDTST